MKRFFGRCLSVALLGATMLGISQSAKADLVANIGSSLFITGTNVQSGNGVTFSGNSGMGPVVTGATNDPTFGGLKSWSGFNTTPSRPVQFYSLAADLRTTFDMPIQPSEYPDDPPYWGKTPYTVQTTANTPQIEHIPVNGSAPPAMGSLAASMIGWLYNSTSTFGFLPANPDGKTLFQRLVEAPTTVFAGALQLATWEIVYDGQLGTSNLNLGLNQGNFFVTGNNTSGNQLAEYNLANTFLAAIPSSDLSMWLRSTISIGRSDGSLQNQITTATPEPATLAMWGLVGGIGAIFSTRWNRNRMQTRLA